MLGEACEGLLCCANGLDASLSRPSLFLRRKKLGKYDIEFGELSLRLGTDAPGRVSDWVLWYASGLAIGAYEFVKVCVTGVEVCIGNVYVLLSKEERGKVRFLGCRPYCDGICGSSRSMGAATINRCLRDINAVTV